MAIALLTASGAEADDFKVNTGADLAPNGCTKNDCSVREAIIAANKNNGKDTVILRSGRLTASRSRASTRTSRRPAISTSAARRLSRRRKETGGHSRQLA